MSTTPQQNLKEQGFLTDEEFINYVERVGFEQANPLLTECANRMVVMNYRITELARKIKAAVLCRDSND